MNKLMSQLDIVQVEHLMSLIKSDVRKCNHNLFNKKPMTEKGQRRLELRIAINDDLLKELANYLKSRNKNNEA